MGILLGMVVVLGCLLGGFVAMGGHLEVLVQPFEYVIICGSSFGTFLVANPPKVIKNIAITANVDRLYRCVKIRRAGFAAAPAATAAGQYRQSAQQNDCLSRKSISPYFHCFVPTSGRIGRFLV